MKAIARLTCTLLLALSASAWADVSRDDAAAIAQRVSNGRVLAVERADAGGRPVWRVKVLTSGGDVRVILVDVASGRTM
jgi:uncharacterized membrane protein YkoI